MSKLDNPIRLNYINEKGPAFLLDQFPNAAAGFSLRRLRRGYRGPLIRVRRSSDNTEQDIGSTISGRLDITALLSFVGEGNGFVTVWYDQISSTPSNLTQSTTANQPRIVNSGAYEADGMYFNGTSSEMVNGAGVMTGNFEAQFTALAIQKCPAEEAGFLICWGTSGQGSGIYPNGLKYDILNGITGGNSISRTAITNITAFFYNNQNTQIALNGVDGGTTGATYDFAASSSNLVLGNRQGGSTAATYYEGNVKEIILYNTDHRAVRARMQANMNAFWEVY